MVWFLWDGGESQLPETAARSVARWRRLNPRYSCEVIDDAAMQSHLVDFVQPDPGLPIQALSDVLRVELLVKEGGYWSDVSVVPSIPLEDWIDPYVDRGFFCFERPGRDRLVASWFLAMRPGHPIGRWLRREIQRFWDRPRSIERLQGEDMQSSVIAGDYEELGSAAPYFWFHYLFERMITVDPICRSAFEGRRRLLARDAGRLGKLIERGMPPTDGQVRKIIRRSPVHKLDWRQSWPEVWRALDHLDAERTGGGPA